MTRLTWLACILRAIVRGYQLLLRPLLPAACRYEPSCSHYALEALERHGAIAGLWLATRRVLRCHPWAQGGFDPVPEPATRLAPDRPPRTCSAHGSAADLRGCARR